jgi:hypothetical protein
MTNTIESNTTLSNSGYHRSGSAQRWWLRGVDGFVEIGSHRGDKPLTLTLDLVPGRYTLGCGRGKDAIRQTVTVEA